MNCGEKMVKNAKKQIPNPDANRDELGLNFTWGKLCDLYENEEVE